MAQGQAFTTAQRDTIIKSLQPYLEMGFSRNKACGFIGLKPQTLSVWVQDDEALLIKLQGWENAINMVAMQNIAAAIQKENESEDLRLENTWKWADRKMKDDGFTTKVEQELSNPDGNLKSITIIKHGSDNQSTSETD